MLAYAIAIISTGAFALAAPVDAPSPHLVGWVNLAVPGGGQLLLGDPLLAGAQAVGETSTFLTGYALSEHSPPSAMTLDGFPEHLPGPNNPSHDISRQLYADWLQEAGLKFHMVNVYNAYREAGAEHVDSTSTADLFLAPFRGEVLADPWVWGGLAVTAAAVGGAYALTANRGIQPVGTLNAKSQALYGITYGAVYPIGSGAPEEMFYRGFLQNELEALVPSPFFSIPLSTLAFAFSHQASDRPTAALSGAYAGLMTHHYGGRLSPAIAYHFWSDVMTGILAFVLLQRAQYSSGGTTPIAWFQVDL